jgi:hypothetical protein
MAFRWLERRLIGGSKWHNPLYEKVKVPEKLDGFAADASTSRNYKYDLRATPGASSSRGRLSSTN